MKAGEVKKILNITQQTLHNYIRSGKIRYIEINDHNYVYNEEDVYKLIGIKKEKKNRINVSYSRVSLPKQKSDLKSQTIRLYDYCTSKGIELTEQYEDIKSGMNFTDRRNFNLLSERVIKGEIELIVIENKDRLCRFGFEMLESIFKYFGTKIVVISDLVQNKTYEQELTEDLISIIHYFSMKSYSNRRRLNKLKKELEND